MPLFLKTAEFPYNSVRYVKENHHAKTSSIRPDVSIEHRLVTDRYRHRQTQGHSTALAWRRAGKKSPKFYPIGFFCQGVISRKILYNFNAICDSKFVISHLF